MSVITQETKQQMPVSEIDAFAELLVQDPDDTLDILIRLHELEQNTGLDLTRIHCSKTGQPVGTCTEQDIRNVLAYHNTDKLETIAHELDLATSISRIWLHTGPENLTRLQEIDPRGFFCYCLSVALQNQYMEYTKQGSKKFKTAIHQREFRNSVVKAWYMTAKIDAAELAEANKSLRLFMYLNLHNRNYFRVPWHLMRLNVTLTAYKEYMARWVNNKPQQTNAHLVDLDQFPMMPHEFATPWGIVWINKVLEKHIKNIKRQMDYNDAAYAHLMVGSAFKPGGKNEGFYQMISDIIGDQFGSIKMSLRDMLDRADAIKGRSAKGNAITKHGAITLNLTSEDLSKPEKVTVAIAQPKPVTMIKLNIKPTVKSNV